MPMTKGGRIFAGIIALIGAGVFLIGALVSWIIIVAPPLNLTLTLIVAIFAFICAILTLADKSFGPVILLLLGIFMFLQPLLVDVFHVLSEYYITEFLWFDAVLILLGGLIGTLVGSEK